jgi:hypothetical protein
MKISDLFEGENSSLAKTYRKAVTEKPSETFLKTLKDNPGEIIDWCNREIKEYQNLIKLIKKNFNTSQD